MALVQTPALHDPWAQCEHVYILERRLWGLNNSRKPFAARRACPDAAGGGVSLHRRAMQPSPDPLWSPSGGPARMQPASLKSVSFINIAQYAPCPPSWRQRPSPQRELRDQAAMASFRPPCGRSCLAKSVRPAARSGPSALRPAPPAEQGRAQLVDRCGKKGVLGATARAMVANE